MEKNNDRNAKIGEEEKSENKKKGKLAKIRDFYKRHKFLRFLSILLLLVIVFVLAALIAMGAINGSRPEQAYLPQVVYENSEDMLTESEAIALLEEAGFTNITVERESSDTIEAGYVISINPDKTDYLYNLDQAIILTVSSGPEIVVLPSQIIGEQEEEIASELEKMGLTVNVTYETSETVESGIILSVDPDEGEEITKSTPVNLVVSSGSQYKDITMINVVGYSETDARTMLSALSSQLTVNVTYDEDSSKADGVVLSQTISEGKVIKENEEITLTVNQLPTESTITFDINVASYYEDTTTDDTEDDENTTNTTSTTTSKNVTVVIYIGGVQVSTKSVSSDTESYTESYTTSGSKSVQITVGGNEVYKGTIDFSSGDRTVTVSK